MFETNTLPNYKKITLFFNKFEEKTFPLIGREISISYTQELLM